MNLHALGLPGLYRIELLRHRDQRGYLSRTFCKSTFADWGLCTEYRQHSTVWNEQRGVLRGMHYQCAPHEEVKLVRCTRGSLFDVLLDIREESPTYGKWISVELSWDEPTILYVPEGIAHGYQTLTEDTEVLYQISVDYEATYSRGINALDDKLSIPWPVSEIIMSDRDRSHPNL